ncbi:DUF881 domain-containing protein [Candidatus Peregrinibacteria bacterium]|nr:DUF881 domain-containing protein [Candidatus Peregrinibacteria bacterium]
MKLFKQNTEYTTPQIIILAATGLLLGFLLITQSRYFTSYVTTLGRDSGENVFRKIQMLKTSNNDLAEEISKLELQLQEVSNQALALETINKDIQKNKLITGDIAIYGPGIEIEIGTQLSDIWFTDIVNELFAAGVQAVSINSLRLTDTTIGFDKLPNGQIMLNNVILTPPYKFAVIGEKTNIKQVIETSGGIIERLKSTYQDFNYKITEKDRIEMSKI